MALTLVVLETWQVFSVFDNQRRLYSSSLTLNLVRVDSVAVLVLLVLLSLDLLCLLLGLCLGYLLLLSNLGILDVDVVFRAVPLALRGLDNESSSLICLN